LSFSTLTLLATVGGCGRTSGGSEQSLLDLAAKSSGRLQANSTGAADSLTKRNASATEKLLRGLIDKEREERMAEDKRLGERIDALGLDLAEFKKEVGLRFGDVDSRDKILRLYLEAKLEDLKKADEVLGNKISDLDKTFAGQLADVENALKNEMSASNAKVNSFIVEEAGKIRGELAAKDAALRAKMAEDNAKLAVDLEVKRKALEEAIQKNADSIAATNSTLKEKEEALRLAQSANHDELKKLLELQRSDLQKQITSTNAALTVTNLRITSINATLTDAINKTRSELIGEIQSTKTSLQKQIDDTKSSIKEFEEKQKTVNTNLTNAIAANAEADVFAAIAAREDLNQKISEANASMFATRDMLASTEATLRAAVSQTKEQLVASLSAQKSEFESAKTALSNEIKATNENLVKAKSDLDNALANNISAVKASLETEKEALLKKINETNKTIATDKENFDKQVATMSTAIETNRKNITSTQQALNDFRAQVAREKAALENAIAASKLSLASEMKALIKKTDDENRAAWKKELDAVAAEAKADSSKNASAIDSLKAKSMEIIDEIAKTNERLNLSNSEQSRIKNQLLASIDEASKKSAADLAAAADGLLAKMAASDAQVRADIEKKINTASAQSAADLQKTAQEITLSMKTESVNMQLKMAALTEQIVKVDKEGFERSKKLEEKMNNDISNVRGEFTAKIAALDAAVNDTRDVLGKRITEGLANVSSVMETKLAALDGKMSDALKVAVTDLTKKIKEHEDKVALTEQKLRTDISAQFDGLRTDTNKKYEEFSKSLNDKIDSTKAALKGQIDALIEAQRKLEADAARQVAIILEKMAQQDVDIAAYDARLAQATAEARVAIELEKSARKAELDKLQTDLSSLNNAQRVARETLEADLKKALAGQEAVSAAEIENLRGALKELDNKTLVTVGDMRKALATERATTEAQILQATINLDKKLNEAAVETQKVAARAEAIAQAQEEFKAYVAKNYATKGELKALELRVEGLEEVTTILKGDLVKSSEKMKDLISAEVSAAKDALATRIQSVEANVDSIKNKLGGAIDDYQKQINEVKNNMTRELVAVRADMKTQDAALLLEIEKNADKAAAVNADLMLSVKVQAANFETLSQNVKKELSDKIVELEGRIDNTDAALKAEKEAVQKKFAEVVAAEQLLKQQITQEIVGLKDHIKAVEKTANQSLTLAEQNAEELKLVKADIEQQKKYVKEKFDLTDGQLKVLNDDLAKVKEEFNKRLEQVAKDAENLVANLGREVQDNFKKVATDIAQMKAQDKAMQSALSGNLVEVVNLRLEDATMTAFSDGVSSDLNKVTKTVTAGKTEKGPLVVALQLFSQVRTNFLQALQPKMPTRSGSTITRVEAFDKSFEPIMVACGGRADADFANAFGRDSFDFLADEFLGNLLTANRGSNMDPLFFKQPKLTDGSSLHHFTLLEAHRKLEGGADDPHCVSQIKAWAAEVLNGTSEMSKDVRARLTAHAGFQRSVTDFSKSVSDLKAPMDNVELRVAKLINNRHTTIASAMENITNAAEKLGKDVKPSDAANTLLGKMAVTITEAVDATFEAIQREEEFDQIVAVQKRFAQNEDDDKKQNERLKTIETDVANMKKKLEEFNQTANDVKNLAAQTQRIESSLGKALDVMLSLAIRSGHPDLVAATKSAGEAMGYAVKEISPVKPAISEVQHFFASPALADSSDTCTGNSVRRGAGVKFWHSHGTTQCWVNFRVIPGNQWTSAVGTIWFRVFGAADKMRVRSNLCDKASCDSTFGFQFNSTVSTASVSGASAKLTGQPTEGVFDVRIPDILEPYVRRSQSWSGEKIYFTPFGGASEGTTSTYTVQLYSPLILDFTNVGRPLFSSLEESKVRFDLNGDGTTERTGWIGGYGGVGLLALDLNGNGQIDSGLELFGEGTRIVNNGRKARDGYAALAQYDSNRDGVIDAQDPIYGKLKVWFDKNKNGRTDAGELLSLGSSGVTKVGLKHSKLTDHGRFVNGNELRTTAKFWGPAECGKSGCNSYDVYFSTGFTTALKGKK